MKQMIGVCLGASTVSFVRLAYDTGKPVIKDTKSIPHYGDPKGILIEHLDRFNPDRHAIVATGRKFRKILKIPAISESEATEYALNHITDDNCSYSGIASLGGETFMVYSLDRQGRISNVHTKNQCASGTGEFFLQQIKRMGLGLEDTSVMSTDLKPFRVSGRCSVFCKSDCTHALNKGTPKEEVTSGLAMMIAEKVEELLGKIKGTKFLLTGGLTKNRLVMSFLKEKFPGAVIPEEAPYFEALGAALYGLINDIKPPEDFNNIIADKQSSFVFHKPLTEFESDVEFKELDYDKAVPGDECILGLDVGSTTTKAVIIRISDCNILASVYLYTHGNPVEASRQCYRDLMKQVPEDIKLLGLGVTGSGRQIAGLHALTDGIVNEIIAHAEAALFFDPEVDTIFEIGGQDAKYTYIVNGVPADYAMNEACSAGTGSFLEEAAYESLKIKLDEIEPLAMRGANPPNFSDQCSAFISSDIKTAQQENISRDDIVAGLVYSVCMNYVNRVKGNRPVGKKVFMQGGVCYNKAVPVAMSALTDKEIVVPPEPGLMGAFGIALVLRKKIKLGIFKNKEFSLSELSDREVQYSKPFTCPGGKEKCDLACTINMIEVGGKKYPFGGSCNKYYNLRYDKEVDTVKYDYVRKRQELVFEKYAPDYGLPGDAPSIGINKSFLTNNLYPLYHNFFSGLGFRLILPDEADEDGIEKEMTAMCFPGQVSHGLFKNLLDKKPDYIFIPNHLEINVGEEEYQRLDFNCTCIFVSGEPYYLKQAFADSLDGVKLISPIFNFSNGYEEEYQKFLDMANEVGIVDGERIRSSFEIALKKQQSFSNEMFDMGREFLEFLKRNPDAYAMVLLGRSYNTFSELANKGIPRKFASRGVYVLPYDMFDFREETIDNEMYWEGGKKILKASKIVKNHPQLFATFVSNFSCAPDSMIIPMFRSIMGVKPSLTLELDSHSADAGINTRIDAALDIIENYRLMDNKPVDPDYSGYKPSKLEYGKDVALFVNSDGERIPLNDSSVDIIVPSMGDLSPRLFAAGLKSQGFNAIALPESNTDILKYGRSVSTGKECLPLLLCIGSMLDYIENSWNGNQNVLFFIVQGAGNCRLGYYPHFMKEVIKRKQIPNVTTLELMHEDGFAGLGPKFATRGIQTLIAGDILDDVRSGILANAVDPQKGERIFEREFDHFIDLISREPDKFYTGLKNMARTIRENIPAKRPIEESKYIALVGEMYVRRDRFAHKWLAKYFAEKGFVLKDAYISEWIFYVDYLLKEGLYEPLKSIKNKYERLVRISYMRYAEFRIKKILAKSGYYEYSKTRIGPIVDRAKHIVPLEFKGEPLLVCGSAIHESLTKYSGIVNIGPFGCMQSRFAEAVTLPEMNVGKKIESERLVEPDYELPEVFHNDMSIPFLSIETDGNVYPQVIEARLETFTLQAQRISELISISKNGRNGK